MREFPGIPGRGTVQYCGGCKGRADYKTKKDDNAAIDVSADVNAGEIPLFLQWDERWGYRSYGGDFLAVTGCGPTALSMV